MNDSERTHDRALTTEQIAATGAADMDRATPGQHSPGDGRGSLPRPLGPRPATTSAGRISRPHSCWQTTN